MMLTLTLQISMHTFMDNTALLIVEDCLIKELPNMFNAEQVACMDEAMLANLAAESSDLRIERAEEQRRLEILESGLSTCEMYDDSNLARK